MFQKSHLLANSHWELVERAERLMGEMSDDRLLPAYDAALAADNDALLVNFCGQLQIVLRQDRVEASEAQVNAAVNRQSPASQAA
jgi:hypothetical protein